MVQGVGSWSGAKRLQRDMTGRCPNHGFTFLSVSPLGLVCKCPLALNGLVVPGKPLVKLSMGSTNFV